MSFEKHTILAVVVSVIFLNFNQRVGWTLYSTFLVAFPQYLHDPFAGVYNGTATYSCNVDHEHIATFHGVDSFSDIVKKIDEQGLFAQKPLLFKNFLVDPALTMQEVRALSDDVKITFSNVSWDSFGNVFMQGVRPFGSAEMTLGEAFSLQQTGGANVFASFTSFLDKDAIAAVLKEGGVDVVRDTNFISNFERDVISTKFHAVSPIESFAVQLQGRKLWLFMEPADIQAYSPVGTRPTFFTSGSEEHLLAALPRLRFAVTAPGDVLYFPPQWGHAVVTSQGPNFMLNVRRSAFLKSACTDPFRLAEWALGESVQTVQRLLQGARGKTHFSYANVQGFHAAMSRFYQRKHGLETGGEDTSANMQTNGFAPADSPCKDKWVGLLRGE